MRKKNLFIIAALMLSIFIFLGGVFWRDAHPKYIFLEDISELDNLNVSEIYMNEVNSIIFNYKKTRELIKADLIPVLPAKEPEKIEQIVECLKNAKKLTSSYEGDTGSIMFFKTWNNIYYIPIGWDNEKFYGHYWESKELMDLIKLWKQETIEAINRGREKAMRQQEELEKDPVYQKFMRPIGMGAQDDEQEDISD